MSEELIPPFTGPMSKETAQFRANQAVEYYRKHLKVQNSHQNTPKRDNRDHVNGYSSQGQSGQNVPSSGHRRNNVNKAPLDGRHSAQAINDPPPERFVRGGQRATVHGTQSGRQWPQNSYNNQGQNQNQNNRSHVVREHRSGSKKRYSRGLHRSNSNLEESMEYINVENLDVSLTSKREYGSTSSLDMMNASTSSDSFFQMLENLRPESTDQRSPAPSKIKEVLRGSRVEVNMKNDKQQFQRNLEKIANGSVIPNRPISDEVDDGTQSPRTKAKFKQKERKLRSKSITPETVPGVWKRIKGAENAPELELKGDDRFRRKAFTHYDSQSVGFDINKVLKRKASVPIAFSNISTGASAASGTRESYAGEADAPDIVAITDDGDGRTNDLVHSCSFFRNETGGEGERIIGLTQINKQSQSVTGRDPSSHTGISAIVLNRSPQCCGVTILDSSPTAVGHILPPYITHKGHVVEFVDTGAYYYRHFFNGQEHQNYFGIDDNLGPVSLSIKREKIEERENNLGKSEAGLYQYRVILRTSELLTLRGTILEDAIPASGRLSSSRGVPIKDMLEFMVPELQSTCLRQAVVGQKTNDQLMKLDEQKIFSTYKIGIMYCKAGQNTEEDMYNNEHGGPAFEEFLNCIGDKVRLKGFEKYRAQLDNKSDSTGSHSVYTTFHNSEIMFHVSTLLPYTPKNQQQLLRKRHIGNDIVTIVFQEPGSLPFTAKCVRSQFQHVFIIIRVHNPCSEKTSYSIAISRSKDVPPFGPTIPENAKFPKSPEFAEFLMAKVVNAENAAHRSEKFSAMAIRTRQEYLKDLATNYVTNNSLESASRLSKFALSGKKKEKNRGKVVPDNFALGAVVWMVQVEEGQDEIICYLAIAAETMVIVEQSTKDVIFTTHCGAVIGWTSQALSVRLYYNQGECLSLKPHSGDMEELQEIVTRLSAVTPGCETSELTLKRNGLGQLGFHIQAEGIVTDVENYGFAYEAGLRKGSRLVEICKVASVTLTHDQMVDLLRTSATVKVVVIPPMKDGGPRGVVNLHANHHYSSFSALNAVIQAEYTLHQRQTRSSSSSSEPMLSPISPASPREVFLREPVKSQGYPKTPQDVEKKHNSYSEFHESWELREIKRHHSRESNEPKTSNTNDVRHSNSKDIRHSNSSDIRHSNSSDIRNSNSSDIRNSNSSDVRSSNSSDFRNSNSSDIRNSNSSDIRNSYSRDIRNSNSSDLRNSSALTESQMSIPDLELSISSTQSQASQRGSNTLPLQKKLSTSSLVENRGDMKSPPSRTFYITDSTWQTSSLPRNTTVAPVTNTASYHGYQDSVVSSGRGSLFEGRETADHYGSSSRGLDDSSYGTLEDRHTRSGSKDSTDKGDKNTFGSTGRDWSSSRQGPQRPPPPQQSSHWQGDLSSSSHSTYLTSSTENLYSSSSQSASQSNRKQHPANQDFTSVQHGNYAHELLKQSQNTKYLLSQGSESSRREGVNSANSSSVNLSDTSFSSGGSGNTAANMPQQGPHGDPTALSREDLVQGRRRANTSSTPHTNKSRPPMVGPRNPVLPVSPLSSAQSSPRSSHKNLSGMSSEESLSTRLRPGVTTKLIKSKGSTNLQDDLMRLIDPDIAESDLAGLLSSRSSSRRLSGRLVRTMSDESLHSGKGGLGAMWENQDVREALWATKHTDLYSSRENITKQHRLSPRAKVDPSQPRVPAVPSQDLDWSSLVDVATKAIESSDPEPKDRVTSPVNSTTSSSTSSSLNKSRERMNENREKRDRENRERDIKIESLYRTKPVQDRPPDPPTGTNPPVWRSVVANPQVRIAELEMKVDQLEDELAQERQESAALDSEVQRLREENGRLQEESQTAAAQLRRFTEWFFTTIDRQ